LGKLYDKKFLLCVLDDMFSSLFTEVAFTAESGVQTFSHS